MLQEQGLNDAIIHRGFLVITGWIYSFHMPVFIALSGVLWRNSLDNNKLDSLDTIVMSKAKRLLLPYVVVWLLWNMPIKYLTHYYDGVSAIRIVAQMIFCKDVYLWYLVALFCSFLVCFSVMHIVKKSLVQGIFCFVLCIFGVIADKKLGYYVALGNPLKYVFWLWIGVHWKDIYAFLREKNLWKHKWIVLFAAVEIAINHMARRNIIPLRKLWNVTINPFLMFIVLCWIAKVIADKIETSEDKTRLVRTSSYCFGCYLYTDSINYLILYLTTDLLGLSVLSKNAISVLIILLRIFLTTIVAIIVTFLLKKGRIKNLC